MSQANAANIAPALTTTDVVVTCTPAACTDGTAPTDVEVSITGYSITIGGVMLAPADVLYAGVSPGYIGLYQINLRVPAGVPSGNQPMVIKIGNNSSPAGGYLTVQ